VWVASGQREQVASLNPLCARTPGRLTISSMAASIVDGNANGIRNGTLTPPTAPSSSAPEAFPVPAHTSALAPPDTSSQKRKREDDSPDQPQHRLDPHPTKFGQTQRDWLVILAQHDISPSFLKYEFSDERAMDTSEPAQKKARLSDASHKTSIFARLNSAIYAGPDDLRADAARVSKAIATSVRSKESVVGGHDELRPSVDGLKQIQRAKAFAQFVTDVVDRQDRHEAADQLVLQPARKEGSRMGKPCAKPTATAADGRTGTVLTLFGNAPTPKQLFSSLQGPSSGGEITIKAELPVEEMSLPNGLTATKVMSIATVDEKKCPTLEEAFAPPYNLSALQPPKARKRSSTRDNTTVSWEFKDTVSRGSKKGGYTVQQVTVGDWIEYGGLDAAQDVTSLSERRKQRDRALSSGAESAKDPSNQMTLEEATAKEEEALFRRAYSSFAPSYDNAKALIPAETKNMIWWQKVGSKRFHETFALDPALVDERSVAEPTALLSFEEPELTDDDLACIMEDLDHLEEDMTGAESASSSTNVDGVLRKISELLETLASHQRIRNASLPPASASRTPISPAPTLASRTGKPEEPAEEEMHTYQNLQRELAYLILRLPPYAVAKLDGDRLAELGISKLILFESKNIKGTMEEDQVARLAKYNALATAAGISTLTRASSSSSGQHYSQTSQRTPAIGQAANTRYGQSGQLGAIRTPATQPQYQRSTSNQSQYGTPTATAPRPVYAPTSQYMRPGATQQTYGQTNGQQYYQQRSQPTPGGYGANYSQHYSSQQTPQSQQRPTYSSSQPLAQFQQRSHAAAANAVAYQANASTPANTQPAKPGFGSMQPVQTPAPASLQQRPIYQHQQTGSGRATPNYPSEPQTPVNGYQHRPPPLPIASRPASGTPQPPPTMAAVPYQPPLQSTTPQVHANGHA